MSIDIPGKLIKIGECPDFALCKGIRKDGAHCTMPVNLSVGCVLGCCSCMLYPSTYRYEHALISCFI